MHAEPNYVKQADQALYDVAGLRSAVLDLQRVIRRKTILIDVLGDRIREQQELIKQMAIVILNADVEEDSIA